MSNNESDAHILRPNQDVFLTKHTIDEEIVNPGKRFNIFEKTEYPKEGGIYVYYKGMPYPKKGFPYPDAVWANDIMKRITVTFIKSITKDLMIPLIGFAILPWKKKIRIIDNLILNYNRISKWLVQGTFLTDERYSNPARSIRKIVQSFLLNLGITRLYAEEFSRAVGNMIEYDDAYRFRIQDIMTEAVPYELANNPKQELLRLLDIFQERETAHQVIDSIAIFKFISKIIFFHPKIKKAWKEAIEELTEDEFKWLQLDNADRYHVLLRGDYKFLGRTFEERKEIYIETHRRSKCCEAKVGILLMQDGTTFEGYECTKCKKKCEFGFIFPPEVEIV